jgi:hypothetical protein
MPLFVGTRRILRPVPSGSAAISDQTIWNSADKNASITLSASDRTATCGSGGTAQGVRSVGFKSGASGKYYFEVVVSFTVGDCWVGITQSSQSLSAYPTSSDTDALILYAGLPTTTEGIVSSGSSYASPSLSSGDSMMVAIDFDNSRAYYGAEGSWWDGANPAGNTGGLDISSRVAGNYYIFGGGSINTDVINLPQTVTYTPPSGFSVWS